MLVLVIMVGKREQKKIFKKFSIESETVNDNSTPPSSDRGTVTVQESGVGILRAQEKKNKVILWGPSLDRFGL